MARTTIDQLVGILPRVDHRFPLTDEAAEIRYVPEPDPRFVPPTLERAAGGSDRPSLVLVEARAAAGKSTLARQVARMTGSPLWDVSEIFVGTGTLLGRLFRSFGPKGLNDVIAAAAEGDFLLIIDALDEAEMHASGPSFDAFLHDLEEFFGARATRPRAILFGRSETIEYVELYLGERVPVDRYSIDGFDRPAADLFIQRYLEGGSYPPAVQLAHRRRPSVFQGARDALYDLFISAISPDRNATWQSDRVREFMGYAPVLAVLTDFLAGYAENYQRLGLELARLGEDGGTVAGPPQWELLTTVLHRLLVREQEKFLKQATRLLGRTADLYGPDAQCSMILRDIDRTVAIEVPTSVPPDKAESFRQLVANALLNHPFRGSVSGYANHVMRDYVHAWGLRALDTADRQAVRKAVRSESYLPSPLLARFFISVPQPEPGHRTCFAEDFGLLYESFIALRTESLSILGDDTGVTALIGAETSTEPVFLTIEEHGAGIPFRRRLVQGEVRGVSVTLGLTDKPFSLGPDVLIDAELLDVRAGTVRVYNKSGPVRMRASAGYTWSSSREPTLTVFGDEPFEIHWAEARYPWVRYRVEHWGHGLDDQPDDVALKHTFRHFSRIIRYFFRSNLIYLYRPLLGPAWQSGELRRAFSGTTAAVRLVEYLIARKVLVSLGSSLYLDVARLKGLGITLTDLHMRVLSDPIRSFLVDYLATLE